MNNSTTEQAIDNGLNLENIFADVAIQKEHKSPVEWSLEDCKDNLQVIFKESKNENEIDISVRLQGLTFLKLHEGKTIFKVKKGTLTKDEVLQRVLKADDMILEAHKRLKESLRKAQISRETTHKRRSQDQPPMAMLEEDGQEYPQPPYS